MSFQNAALFLILWPMSLVQDDSSKGLCKNWEFVDPYYFLLSGLILQSFDNNEMIDL